MSNQTAVITQPVEAREAKRPAPKVNVYAEMVLLFAFALALRAAFNLTLETRFCHFGDAYYFLMSGSQLLAALNSGVFAHLPSLQGQATAGVNAMTSLGFVDRILIDGPIFPAYLAGVLALVGVNPAAPQFDAHALQISLFNSLLDASACVLIYLTARFGFNRRTGRIAGVLAALYPAAIINTSSCYSDFFGYFMVALFSAAFFATTLRTKHAAALALLAGISGAMLMLAKPVFVVLPALMAGVYFITTRKFSIRSLATACIGAALVFAPWLVFTTVTTGKFSLVVNRYPAYNFMMGNRFESDGWRDYPLPFIPAQTSEALDYAKGAFESHPIEYAAMEIRKIPRLWAGSWNNFEVGCLLTPAQQDMVHQVLLLYAALGLFAAFSLKSTYGRSALVLSVVPAFHFIYVAFEPQSRYAFPAMAAVIPLAAFAVSAAMTYGPKILLPNTFLSKAIATVLCAMLLIVFACELQFRPERFERAMHGSVSRAVQLAEAKAGYVIVDAQRIDETEVTFNGKQLAAPIPVWQLVDNQQEFLTAMSITTARMNQSIEQLRQWWAYPVSAELTRAGGNTIAASGGTIYGDSPKAYADNSVWLPALDRGSWTKRFTTVYRVDPRIYAKVKFDGIEKPSRIQPRLFFVPVEEMPTKENTQSFQLTKTPKLVLGADPTTYSFGTIDLKDTKAGRFKFTADVSAPKGTTNAFPSITFNATVNGKPKQWTSVWQPTSLPVGKQSSRWCVQDEIPAELAAANDLNVTILASPFSADLLFLNKKQALKRSILVNNAKLEIYPRGAYPKISAK